MAADIQEIGYPGASFDSPEDLCDPANMTAEEVVGALRTALANGREEEVRRVYVAAQQAGFSGVGVRDLHIYAQQPPFSG